MLAGPRRRSCTPPTRPTSSRSTRSSRSGCELPPDHKGSRRPASPGSTSPPRRLSCGRPTEAQAGAGRRRAYGRGCARWWRRRLVRASSRTPSCCWRGTRIGRCWRRQLPNGTWISPSVESRCWRLAARATSTAPSCCSVSSGSRPMRCSTSTIVVAETARQVEPGPAPIAWTASRGLPRYPSARQLRLLRGDAARYGPWRARSLGGRGRPRPRLRPVRLHPRRPLERRRLGRGIPPARRARVDLTDARSADGPRGHVGGRFVTTGTGSSGGHGRGLVADDDSQARWRRGGDADDSGAGRSV
jgi:hypothetical protein